MAEEKASGAVSGLVDGEGNPIKTAEIEFRGRRMIVRVPDEVQLAIIRRFADRYANVGKDAVELEKAIRMSGQAIGTIQSVLADDVDREWVEDSLLLGDFLLTDALPIIQQAMEALKISNELNNRAARRAASKKTQLVVE